MSYFGNITNAISTLIEGMKVTMGYFVRPREHVTLQYPDEVWPIPTRNIGVGEIDSYNTIRSKLVVNFEDCIGCKACERACPVDCIDIETFKAGKEEDIGTTSNGTKIKLRVTSFTIDMSECMFCDLCTHPCPEDCIEMTPDYQFISNDNVKLDVTPEERWRDRNHLIYQFSKVSPEERAKRQADAAKIAEAKAAAMAAKKEAAAKAAAEKAATETVASEKATTEATMAAAPTPATTEPVVQATPVPEVSSDTQEMEAIDVPMETIVPKPASETSAVPDIPAEPVENAAPADDTATQNEDLTTRESENG